MRTGLALAELGLLLEDEIYKQAASRMADDAISCQPRSAWFRENDLDDHDIPLTHTFFADSLMDYPEKVHSTRARS